MLKEKNQHKKKQILTFYTEWSNDEYDYEQLEF